MSKFSLSSFGSWVSFVIRAWSLVSHSDLLLWQKNALSFEFSIDTRLAALLELRGFSPCRVFPGMIGS